MRVLFLVTRFPHPPRRGDQVRAFHHLRHLAGDHEITLCVVGAVPAADDIDVVRGLGVTVEIVPNPTGTLRMLRGAWDRRPVQSLPATGSRVRAVVSALAERADVVHAQLVRTGPLVEDLGRPVVLDLVDALSVNLERRSAHDRGTGRWVSSWESRRLVPYERWLVDLAAATAVSTADDAAGIGDPSIHVVPNGVDMAAFAFRPGPRNEPVVVFAGNLGYFPNVDAAVTLAAEIMPALRRTLPAARLVIAGARPARLVRGLAGPGVEVIADPDELAPIVADAAVAVIPMRAGTGIQNKVLEAFAVGTPVVTTARVAAAVGAVDREHLIVAEGIEGFAIATAEVLGAPGLAATLAGNGRVLVEAKYRWEDSAAAIGALWESARR